MSEYTNGPWWVENDKVVAESTQGVHVTVAWCGIVPTGSAAANARLIAAAPETLKQRDELLHALERCWWNLKEAAKNTGLDFFDDEDEAQIEAVIAKAKGFTPSHD